MGGLDVSPHDETWFTRSMISRLDSGLFTKELPLCALAVAAALGCRPDADSPAKPTPARERTTEPDASSPAQTSSTTPKPGPAETSRDASSFAPRTTPSNQTEPNYLSKHPVQVDLHPYCEPEKQHADASIANDQRWLGRGVDYYGRLHQLFAPDGEYVGVVTEEARRRLVVVWEPEFEEWGKVQQRVPLPSPVPVELRPACHTKRQRDLAERVLKDLDHDARVGAAIHAWSLDPSNGGFRVFLLPGSEDAATQVEARLGSIANIWFSRPFGLH